MGFLGTDGSLLTYNQYKNHISCYKKRGIAEFVQIYKHHKDRKLEAKDLHWGEEIEYHMYLLNEQEKTAKLVNNAHELVPAFNQYHGKQEMVLLPEFGNWMIEAVPEAPYGNYQDPSQLLSCYEKIIKRRQIINEFLAKEKIVMSSMASSPVMGLPDSFVLTKEMENEINEAGSLVEYNQCTKSQFILDGTANPHPRFLGLAQSIRERREEKVNIQIPIFKDENTSEEKTEEEPFPGMIYMDAMHFGMGCSCLQITYETQSVDHARYLHDMLVSFTPIMATLSASAPIYKGKLSDNDMRYTVIEQSVDCRKREERDPSNKRPEEVKMIGEPDGSCCTNQDKFYHVHKSRYSSTSHYLSNHQFVSDSYNDCPKMPICPNHVAFLKNQGLDDRLAYHVASLFVRDPIPTYAKEHYTEEEMAEQTKLKDQCCYGNPSGVAHFENLQSTNWNTLRFKNPPTIESTIGWRVEFRPMDIQLTDFENIALTTMVGLIASLVNNFSIDFTLPISLVDVNFERAHNRDALLKDKFFWRINCLPTDGDFRKCDLQETDFKVSRLDDPREEHKDDFRELYIHQILEGDSSIGYIGLIPLIEEYMKINDWEPNQVHRTRVLISFLLDRAKGIIPTGASWIRDKVLNHPKYQKDSLVTQEISHDLMQSIANLDNPDSRECEELLTKKYAEVQYKL